jgi:rhodanese-related sulfurtransferase
MASGSYRGNKNQKRKIPWLWVSLGALIIVVVGILLVHPGKTPPTQNIPTQIKVSSVEITPAQAYAKYQQGAFFLDVRTQYEWNQFHLSKSTLIPLDQLSNRVNELPKDQDIIVVCLSGHRAQSGTAILQQAGLTRVAYLSGGLQAWIAPGIR